MAKTNAKDEKIEKMITPFENNTADNQTDIRLIENALNGSKENMESLILRHQNWIYNITFRMVYDVDTAKDVTQEIIIKILTKLALFNSDKGSFRTWLYKIVFNHVINLKKSKYKHTFEFDESYFTSIPDEDPVNSPEEHLLIEELKIACFNGSLMCFNPRDRFVFTLGAILGVTDTIGSEVMGISKENFRKILSRSKKKLFDFMRGNCGLFDPNNTCHCSKKINGCKKMGFINPDNIIFYNEELKTIEEVCGTKMKTVKSYYKDKMDEFIHHFRAQPFYEIEDLRSWLFKAFEKKEQILLLNS